MKRIAALLGAALLAAGSPAFAGGFGHYDFGEVIRYVDRGEDWSVSIRIGDHDWDRGHRRDNGRHWNRDRDRRYRAPFPGQRWVPPGQYRKGFRRGFRQGYREGFGDGYASANCYEERRDRWGRRIRVELPAWRCR